MICDNTYKPLLGSYFSDNSRISCANFDFDISDINYSNNSSCQNDFISTKHIMFDVIKQHKLELCIIIVLEK